MKSYRIPAKRSRVEINVSNSRFIATAAPVFSVDEARDFIQSIRKEFSDATHNVPAFLVGFGHSVTAHCGDDGEPSGTAGKPALAVLQGSGLGDIAVVVTRYFGGKKLGTGGLVRAYSDAVKKVLESLPLAEKVTTQTLMLEIPYTLYEQIRLIIQEFDGTILEGNFSDQVTINVRFLLDKVEPFQQRIINFTRGKHEACIIETNPNTIIPLQ
jgi:uncharacterized YigZ family protein